MKRKPEICGKCGELCEFGELCACLRDAHNNFSSDPYRAFRLAPSYHRNVFWKTDVQKNCVYYAEYCIGEWNGKEKA